MNEISQKKKNQKKSKIKKSQNVSNVPVSAPLNFFLKKTQKTKNKNKNKNKIIGTQKTNGRNNSQRKPKRQFRMYNPETRLGQHWTQDTEQRQNKQTKNNKAIRKTKGAGVKHTQHTDHNIKPWMNTE